MLAGRSRCPAEMALPDQLEATFRAFTSRPVMAVQCVMIVRMSGSGPSGRLPGRTGHGQQRVFVVGSRLDLDQEAREGIGNVEEALRQPVRGKADAFGDLEQAVLHTIRLGAKRRTIGE